MTFKEMKIPFVLDTSSNNLIDEFYCPALENSIRYDRGVGFFTSGWIHDNAYGLDKFISNGGHARWITSPIISDNDWEALWLGTKAKQDTLIYDLLFNSITDLRNSLENDVLNGLAWLIADGLLDLRIALPRNNLKGEFHSKFGTFYDVNGERISFEGSINDSAHGFQNFEGISVFSSLIQGQLVYVNGIENRFTRLWDNEDPNVRVFELPEAVKLEILKLRSSDRNYGLSSLKNKALKKGFEKKFNALSLFDYQLSAVEAWQGNNYRGIIEMATGTGKTRVAIGCLLLSIHKKDVNIIIISCPQHTILQQWKKDVEAFNVPIESWVEADSSNPNWKIDLQSLLLKLQIGTFKRVIIFTLHSTAKSGYFRETLNKYKANNKILFIGDEVHSLGANEAKKSLLDIYDLRLGLSATPRRWYDDEGSEVIYTYFHSVVYEFSIHDALININPLTGKPYLAPFYYFPIPINLTEDELGEYYELSKKLSGLHHMKDDNKIREIIGLIRIKRANIHKNAANKIPRLDSLLSEISDLSGTILFVAPNQIDQCQRVLEEKRITFHRFTEEQGTTPRDEFNGLSEREYLIERFKDRSIKVLLAIKCLDEGVDVPNARIAMLLASSTNPREYIQRIGRVIRQSEGKNYAFIYDFVIFPNMETHDPLFEEVETRLFEKESIRIDEIASNAINNAEALRNISRYLRR